MSKRDTLIESEILDKLYTLTDEEKRKFYGMIESKLRDPDTYAALNWSFLGLHHFYMGHYILGCTCLSVPLLIIILFLNRFVTLAFILLFAFIATELTELFRSQQIVLRHNNRIKQEALKKITEKYRKSRLP